MDVVALNSPTALSIIKSREVKGLSGPRVYFS